MNSRKLAPIRAKHPITDKLRGARKEHSWTQKMMADATFVLPCTIGRVETGENTDPRFYTIVDMAAALGMEIHLVGEEEWW